LKLLLHEVFQALGVSPGNDLLSISKTCHFNFLVARTAIKYTTILTAKATNAFGVIKFFETTSDDLETLKISKAALNIIAFFCFMVALLTGYRWK